MCKYEVVDEILAEMDIRQEIEKGFFMDDEAYSKIREELLNMEYTELKNVAKKYCIDV